VDSFINASISAEQLNITGHCSSRIYIGCRSLLISFSSPNSGTFRFRGFEVYKPYRAEYAYTLFLHHGKQVLIF
jgi:hypothetical protein